MLPVVLILALFGTAPLLAQERTAPEVIRNAAGQALRNPHILSFNGAVFQVEHAEGVTGVPWDRMPSVWRAGYSFRPPPTALLPFPADSFVEREWTVGGMIQVHGSIQEEKERGFWKIRSISTNPPTAGTAAGPDPVHALQATIFVHESEAPGDWKPGAEVHFRAKFVRRTTDPKTPGAFLVHVRWASLSTPSRQPIAEAERPTAAPVRSPTSRETEVEVSLNEQVELRNYGANRGVTVLREDLDSITVVVANYDKMVRPPAKPGVAGTYSVSTRTSTPGSSGYEQLPRPETTLKTVPRKLAFSGQRLLLYEDPTGVKVYLVQTLATAQGNLRLVVVQPEGQGNK